MGSGSRPRAARLERSWHGLGLRPRAARLERSWHGLRRRRAARIVGPNNHLAQERPPRPAFSSKVVVIAATLLTFAGRCRRFSAMWLLTSPAVLESTAEMAVLERCGRSRMRL